MGIEFLLLLCSIAVWGGTGFVVNHLKYVRGRDPSYRRWVRATQIGVALGSSLIILWAVVITIIMLQFGWLFVMDRVIVILPLLGLPMAAVQMVARTKLSRESMDRYAMQPVMVAVHVMFVGAVMAFWLVAIDIPAIPNLRDLLVYGGTLILSALLLRLHHGRRLRHVENRPPTRIQRIVRRIVFRSCGWNPACRIGAIHENE